MKALKQINYFDLFLTLTGIALAILIRYSLLDFKSIDFFKYTKVWYNTLKGSGFSAFGQNFSNYNPPYLYLLYVIARFFPDTPAVVATKLPSLIADFILAFFAYRIVRLQYADSPIPMFAAFGVLFAPTVILNSAFWGQADALYTSALLGAIYFLLAKKSGLALLLFGLAVSFKAQAVFLLPLLAALWLRKEIHWKYFLFVPVVMLLALVPSWIAGRSIIDLLLIYPAQAGQYEQLTMHAPTIFSWIPDSGRFYPYFYPAGLLLAGTTAIFFTVFIYKSQDELVPPILLELAMIAVIMMPFVLPKMHERNFYPADVISIILAFYFPRLFFVPVVMSVASFFSYQPTLFGVEPVPVSFLALGVLVLIIILGRDAVKQLYPARPETEKVDRQ